MTILLKQIFSLLKLLNSETGSKQIAFGLTLGFILGLSPWLSLQGVFIFLIILVFRVQGGAAFVSAFFFAFAAYLFDPLFHKLGYSVLTLPSLRQVFTSLYNMPIVPYTRFNNSVVMGAGIVGLLLAPFMFFLFYKGVQKYQATVVAKFKETKIWKLMKASSLYRWYVTYEQYIK